MRKYRIGVCRECKVKENDSSRKRLYQCPYCETWFCTKHFDPRLAFIKDLKAIVKYPEARATFEQEEWRREDGHPDFAYSRKRFEELDMEEELRLKLINDALNRSKWGKAYGEEKLERKKVDIKPEPSAEEYLEKLQSHSSKSITDEETAKRSTAEEKPKRKKIAIIVATAIILIMIVVSLWALFTYLPITKPETSKPELVLNSIPFEEDFHLKHGASVEYYFNVSLTRRFEISILSEETINFKLYDYEEGTTIIERKWVNFVFELPVLQRGIWAVRISPSDSEADGRITVKEGLIYAAEFVHTNAVREATYNITISYEDELKETVSVHISIEEWYRGNFVEVWNYTQSGPERNKFSITWTGASRTRDYVVEFTVEHSSFGIFSAIKWVYAESYLP